MPFATTHILIGIIFVELFREWFIKNNKKFPRHYILVTAIGALIPDLDIAAYYVLYFFGFSFDAVHRTFMHTIFVSLILLIIGLISLKSNIKISWIRKHHLTLSTIFFIFSALSLLHMTLDSLYMPIFPLYPLSQFSINFNLLALFPKDLQWLILPTIDGLLLLFWIAWMEFKLKVTDYF